MKHIYLNLKRFDIPKEYGGVNSIAPAANWAEFIIKNTQEALKKYASECTFSMYFPEGHILGATAALCPDSPIQIGSQSVFRDDTSVGGNFGAFTSSSTANAVKAMGCRTTIIGHCEERRDKLGIMSAAGVSGAAAQKALGVLLGQEIKCAVKAGLNVLFCIGETTEEQAEWQLTLRNQLSSALDALSPDEKTKVSIAYEPVWAIGPGKTPPDQDYIRMIAKFIKEITGGLNVAYGGGLKVDNAAMLASIPEVDGGLIALTRFSGEIGFYPDEYVEIIKTYLGK